MRIASTVAQRAHARVVVDGDQRVRRAGAQRRDEPLDRADVGEDEIRDARRHAAAPARTRGAVGRGRRSRRLALQPVILLLHHRYRHAGGEERAVEDLAWLIREHLGEDVEVLERARPQVSGAATPRSACCAAGCGPRRSARRCAARAPGSCTRTTSTRPSAPRALEAARDAGARVVLHLHNYRLVCAVGTCFTRGADCTRCHGRNTLPGLKLNCRGGSRAESAAYAAGLALWQRRLTAAADAIVVPSAFALERLRTLGAPVDARAGAELGPAHVRGALGRGGGRVRAGRGPPHAGEGLRGRRGGLRGGRAAARRRRGTGRSGRSWRRARRAAATTRGSPRASSATSRPPSSRRCASGRRRRRPLALRRDPPARGAGGDGRRACRPSRRARAGSSRPCPRKGLYPAGDVPALAARLAALYRRRRGRRAGAGRRPRSQRPRGHRTCVERHLRPQLHRRG